MISRKLVSREQQEAEAAPGVVVKVARGGGTTKNQTEDKSRRRAKGDLHDGGGEAGGHGMEKTHGLVWQTMEEREWTSEKSPARAKSCSSDQVCPGEGSTLGK